MKIFSKNCTILFSGFAEKLHKITFLLTTDSLGSWGREIYKVGIASYPPR
jgi:hypothetical protein